MEDQRTKNRIGAIIGAVFGVAIGYFAFQYFTNPSVDKQLEMAMDGVNEKCPMMVDAETRMDKAERPQENVFQYNYTLVNYSKDQLDAQQLENNIRPNIVNTIKTDPKLKFFRDNKIIMSYLYRDKAGEFIMKIDVNPEDYL